MGRGATLLVAVAAAFAACVLLPRAASAQQRPMFVEASAGWVGFADDGVVSEGLIGGAARVALTQRLSIGPEIAFIQGESHSHWMLTGNLTFDLRRPAGAGRPRAVPFLTAGGGLFGTRETFSGRAFRSTEGSFTAGGGVRTYVSNRIYVAGEARVGWETHLRLNGAVGVQLTR
jgi:hypothetical protein